MVDMTKKILVRENFSFSHTMLWKLSNTRFTKISWNQPTHWIIKKTYSISRKNEDFVKCTSTLFRRYRRYHISLHTHTLISIQGPMADISILLLWLPSSNYFFVFQPNNSLLCWTFLFWVLICFHSFVVTFRKN